ncbi:DUF998 domain-containing protein [Kitasatospora sp. NPDC051853]|uniref:DUF998 domain-containing protein n=1 Tax=Kitasatospora sp. NPDC051853 TaxID=3364058 RepID=UPI0037AEFE5B
MKSVNTTGAGLALIGGGALAMVAVEGLNPRYALVSETLSRYVHGTAGGLLPLALLAVAAASGLLALRLGPTAGRTGRVAVGRAGRVALAVWAAGLAVAAVFPADPPGHWSRPSTAELVHGSAAFLAFTALPTAAVLLRGRLLRGGPVARWPRLGTALNVLVAATVSSTAVLAVFLVDVMDGGPSLGLGGAPTLVGLAERLVLAADLGWVALALVALAAGAGRGGERRRG